MCNLSNESVIYVVIRGGKVGTAETLKLDDLVVYEHLGGRCLTPRVANDVIYLCRLPVDSLMDTAQRYRRVG